MRKGYVEQVVNGIGDKVEGCRKEAGLTLVQLAEASGVSPAAIHKIEKKEMTPSITVLMKIAQALGKKISFFTEEDRRPFEFVEGAEIGRKGERQVLTSPSGSTMEVLAMFLAQGQMETCIFTFGPGAASGSDPKAHKGEELFLVLEGEMLFTIDGKETALRKGDSIHFHSERPHRWENRGGRELQFLWVMTPLPLSALERWIP
jgi:transcriptional regulator with XRE-family HTH domain